MNGAIDTDGNYVLPQYANKGQDYACPDLHCKQKVFLRKGEVNRPHFSHYSHTQCRFYENQGESADHKNGKLILRNILEQKRDVVICRTCCDCRSTVEYTIPHDIQDIREEYPLGQHRRADVGCKLVDGSMLVFEVFHTSRTSELHRSGQWFEFTTTHIFETYKPQGSLTFQCNRAVRCSSCEEEARRYKAEMEQARNYRIQRELEQQERRFKELECLAKQRQLEHDAKKEAQRKAQQEEEERELERRKRYREAHFKSLEEQRIREHLYKIEQEEARKQREIERDEEIRLRKLANEQKRQEMLEHERLYAEAHKEFLRNVVEQHVYDANMRAPSSVIYNGFEFLHPNEILRFRNQKPRRK